MMPLVLYSGDGPSRDGYEYDDRTGVSYEFPNSYLSRIAEGERFVYHQPRAYTGMGVVGPVTPSVNPGRSSCEILDWEAFDPPLSLKDVDGEYFEVDREAGQANVYWAQGARSITEASFQRIVLASAVRSDSTAVASAKERTDHAIAQYADSATRRAVERFAVDVVLELLRAEFEGVEVNELPPNNPGFDIRVGDVATPLRYVEVKGTQSSDPVFWLTEGERQFSVANAQAYELIVVAAIDLTGVNPHHVHRHNGAVANESVSLEPSQWRGRLI